MSRRIQGISQESSSMGEWTFITNHAMVLSFLSKHPRITAREMSASIGITERATRKIIADLDSAGYITKKREGRRIRYRINPDLPMRHEMHKDMMIGDFLKVLGWREPRKHWSQGRTPEQPVEAGQK